MPRLALVLPLLLLPHAGGAQQYDPQECAERARMLMVGVTARTEGRSRDQAIRALGEELPEDVAAMLADWIYALPPKC